MVGPLPVFQLIGLGLRQLSRPVAARLTKLAHKNKFFKDYICIPLGQTYHFMEIQFKFMAMNLIKPKNVKIQKLTEDRAFDLGTTIVSELFVFSVGAGIVIYDIVRSQQTKRREDDDTESFKFEDELKLLTDRFDAHDIIMKHFHDSFEDLRKTFKEISEKPKPKK